MAPGDPQKLEQDEPPLFNSCTSCRLPPDLTVQPADSAGGPLTAYSLT